ncbi:MAG TPA: TIGR02588 family protein [Candidatus Obscuribacterales bacterium]|jgi:uncharacterized protein (TIGR02588 family)
MSQEQANSEPPKPPFHRSPAEWITFIIASLILLAIAGLVVYEWLAKEKEPPVLSVTPSSAIREVQGNFYLPFAVTNTGGGTAESVQVIAEVRVNGEVEESGEQQIDFLSSGETEAGAFIFTRNPRDGELVLRVASYKLP